MDASRRRARHENGFSLLEVVVALAVSAGFLGVAVPMSHEAVQRLAHACAQREALVVASSALERYTLLAASGEGTFEDRHEDLLVKTSIERVEGTTPAQDTSPVLRRIRVELHAPGATSPVLTLVTYRVGRRT